MSQQSGKENFANLLGWIGAIIGFFWCMSDTNDFGTAVGAALILGLIGYLVGKVVWVTVTLALIIGWFMVRQTACTAVRDAIQSEISQPVSDLMATPEEMAPSDLLLQ